MDRPDRLPASTVLALALLVLSAGVATADCQPAGPLEEELPTAAVVFVGTVIGLDGPVAQLAVQEVWAGQIGERVAVRGLIDPANGGPDGAVAFSEDDRHWTDGETYLVVPWVEGSDLVDSICTSTTEWSDELAVMRPADAVVFGSSGAAEAASGGVPIPLVVIIGVVAVLAGISAVAFGRRWNQSR